MGAPNLLQQLYLKTALNESKDGMFDHPADLEEGNHMRAVRLARAGRYDDAALASNKAEASEMRRGGASKRSIKARFNKKDYAVGSKAHQRFDKAAAKKRDAALKAKGLAEQSITEGLLSKLERLEEGYTSRGGYSKSMTSRILRDNARVAEKLRRQAEARAAAQRAAAAKTSDTNTPKN